jgi:glucans biosynthesis protein
MHGGAAGSGAPFGNTNALKHGKFTRDRIETRRFLKILPELVRKFDRTD